MGCPKSCHEIPRQNDMPPSISCQRMRIMSIGKVGPEVDTLDDETSLGEKDCIGRPSRQLQERSVSQCAAAMSSTSTEAPLIVSLAKQIVDLSGQISACLSSSSQPEPNFSASSTAIAETAEYEALLAPLNDAALDLLRLVNGPKKSLRSFFLSHYDLAALQVALDRGFFHHVPLSVSSTNGEILADRNKVVKAGASVKQIAERAGMDEDRTARILKLLTTHRIFEEVAGDSGNFQHTAASALFARDADFHAMADMQ